ncbi:hypothetical protein [Bartonella tamiae]|uniref:hypothetical protein n=1 Tax=Bartonella tamiae TaxID=373638 RepID=UPI0003082D99|nr:hypothetical protein [Bartonella tamiae]
MRISRLTDQLILTQTCFNKSHESSPLSQSNMLYQLNLLGEEVVILINTTVAGGNASLMAISD